MNSMSNFEKGDVDAMLKDVAPSFTDYGDGSTPPLHSADSLKSMIEMIKRFLAGLQK